MILFLIGMFVGACIMCLLQINKGEWDMVEKYRWNDLIKVKTQNGEYIKEKPTESKKPLVYSEVREIHQKTLKKSYLYRGGKKWVQWWLIYLLGL